MQDPDSPNTATKNIKFQPGSMIGWAGISMFSIMSIASAVVYFSPIAGVPMPLLEWEPGTFWGNFNIASTILIGISVLLALGYTALEKRVDPNKLEETQLQDEKLRSDMKKCLGPLSFSIGTGSAVIGGMMFLSFVATTPIALAGNNPAPITNWDPSEFWGRFNITAIILLIAGLLVAKAGKGLMGKNDNVVHPAKLFWN